MILVIEDDKQIAIMVSKYLEMEGYKVNKSYDGLEGLTEFKRKHY